MAKFQQTEYDRQHMRFVDRFRALHVIYSPVNVDPKRLKYTYSYNGQVAEFRFRQWSAKVCTSRPAIVVDTKTGEVIDVNKKYRSDEELHQAFLAKEAVVKQSNWFQYHIYDKDGKYITGDVIEDCEYIDAIDFYGDEICKRLKEEYFKGTPEAVKRDQEFLKRLKSKNWE